MNAKDILDTIGEVAEIINEVVHSEDGQKIISDVAFGVAQFYSKLTQYGVPPDVAAVICGSFGGIGKK